jgi:hypothetical protein
MKTKKKFHNRSFVSFFLFFNFLILAITGFILYFTPQGRIARWTGWTFLGMNKDQLEGIHTVSSFGFMGAAIFHVFLYNWRAIKGYLLRAGHKLTPSHIKYKKELAAAIFITIAIFIGSYYSLPPFGYIVDFGDQLKKSWQNYHAEAPISGAEKLTLSDFSIKVLKIDGQTAAKLLKSKNIKIISPNQKLKDIAAQNNTSPAHLYETLKNAIKAGNP